MCWALSPPTAMTFLQSPVAGAEPENGFSLDHLPYGIFSTNNNKTHRIGAALGDSIIDLKTAAQLGLFNNIANAEHIKSALQQPLLNDFMQLPQVSLQAVRKALQQEFGTQFNSGLLAHQYRLILYLRQQATLHLPIHIPDYTDFYASREHATRVGSMFRPDNPLLPNWTRLPVAYHGRASSIVASGTAIHRPQGQYKLPEQEEPVFGPTQMLDYELEMACIIGQGSKWGKAVNTQDAHEHIFGFALFNDWSARDIQSWEYQPLGPFLSKNFASSLACWITPIEALQPFMTSQPEQEPEVLPYLQTTGNQAFDIDMEVWLKTLQGHQEKIATANYKEMYWSIAQQIAHHTVTGCGLRTGDVLASGTVSGKEKGSEGCLLEATKRGKEPLALQNGEKRGFLEDGDTVTLKAFARKQGLTIAMGSVVGQVKGS